MVAMAFTRVVCTLFSCILVLCHSLKIETPNYSRNEYKNFVDSIWDVIGTLGADTPDLSIIKTNEQTGIDLEFTTQDDFKYHFFPVSSTSMQLQIKAPCDAYIAFSTEPFEQNPVELIIGANNTKSQFRKGQRDVEEEVSTQGILSAREYRRFLLRWGDGVILVWRTGEHRPFISWVPPVDTTFGYVGVRTGTGVNGSWKIKDLSLKRDKEQGPKKQISTIQFKVKTTNDAHIGFFTTPTLFQGQMIEIVIGGWSNSKSVIRRGNFKLNDVVAVEVPGLLNSSEYRGFWVHWGDVISIGREGEHCPFMTWPDPEPFQATYLGIHTGFGAHGSWKIEDWDEIDTPDKKDYTYQPFAAVTALSDSSSSAIDSW